MEDEKLLSFIDHMGVVVAGVVREEIQDHETRMHSQPDGTASREASGRIPDVVVARMVEALGRLGTRSFAIAVLARIYGYPEDQIAREVTEWEARDDASGESRASA